MTRVWERHFKDNPDSNTLPFILPLVLFQGGHKWNVAADFADLVLGPGAHRKLLRRHTPSFMYRLHDLGSVDPAALRGEIATRATLRVLQATGAGALDENLKELLDTLGPLFHAQSATELSHALLNYIFKADDSLDTKRVKALLDETPDPEYKEKIMSLAEQFKTEGEALGLRKGMAESSRQIIIRMLTRRFGAVPARIEERLSAIEDSDVLADWRLRHRRCLRSTPSNRSCKGLPSPLA